MATRTDQRKAAHPAPTTQPRLVVVGNLTLDDVVLPDGTTQMASVGGNSLYSALGARLWQPSIGLVTRRGEDFPRDLAAELRVLGIAADGVTNIPGPTVRNWIVYEANGDRSWIYRTPRERSREVAVQPEDFPVVWLLAESLTVHIAAMAIEAAEAMVRIVRRHAPGATITLDTHEDYVASYQPRLRSLAAQVNAFLPSRAELADLVGYDDPERAITDLGTLPTPLIVVKMEADGVLVWDKGNGELYQVAVAPGPVVDVTGAGDAFCGGFAAGLSLGCAAPIAAQRGIISAAYTVAGFGSLRLSAVEPAEAQTLLEVSPPAVRPLPSPPIREDLAVPGTDRSITSSVDIMREEIAMIPGLIEDQLARVGEQVRRLAGNLYDTGIEHLYLTGCGDSAFAGAAAALAFQKLAGIDAEGVHALDLARYRVRYLPERSAIVGISFSGKVGRTIEAVAQARRFGHRVIALTGNPDSPLAREASDVLTLAVPTLGYSPGTSTYLAMLVALFDLAVSWAQARGRSAEEARAQLRLAPQLARRTLEQSVAPARELAQRLVGRSWVTFLGAGPNEPTARFGAAKLFEGPRVLGVSANIEEWAHEGYFVSGKGMPVVLVAPSGASFDRANEILAELRFIGADATFIGDRRPAIDTDTFIPLAPGLPEELSPILAALPLSLLAFHLTQASGQESFSFSSPEAAQEHYQTIHRATVGEPA